MARLPSRFDLSGPESLRSGRQISSADTTAIGRGLQSLGSSIQQAGGAAAALAEKERRKQQALDLARANAFQDQQNIELGNSFDTDTDYGTFGTRAEEKARKIATDASSLISDRETRELWLTQAGTTAKAAADGIRDRGVTFKQADDIVKFDEALEIQRRIYVDPNTPPEAKAKARASIEGALEVGKGSGLLDPAQYGNRKANYLDGADFDRAKLDTSLGAPADAANVIRDFEGFKAEPYWDVNAYRVGYGSDTITREDGSVVRAKPGMVVTRADADRDLARRLGDFQSGIVEKIGQSQWDNLSTGAKAALSSVSYNYGELPDRVAKAARTGDPEAIAAAIDGLASDNDGVNAGRRAREAAIVRGGAEPDYVSRLSPEQRRTVYDMRNAEIAQANTAAAAEARVQYAALDGQIGLGIVTGDIVSEEQILSSALDDADKAKHLKAFRSESDATAEARDFLAGLSDGTARDVNPYNSEDRSLIDKSYDLLSKAVPEDQRDAAGLELVKATGVVPKAVVADLRQSLNANDPATVAAGMGRAAQIYDISPMALDGVENGGELRAAALTYDEMVNGRGMSDVDAAAEVIRLRDPKERQKAETLDAAWNQAIKDSKFVVQDLRAAFDPNWLPGEPSAGLTPLQESGLSADYLGAAERAFRGPAQGDAGLAKTIALDEIKRTYGVSSVSGGETIMKYPPEKFYPPVDGSYGYIREMAMTDAKAMMPEATNVTLLATAETARDIKASQPPRYTMLVQGPDGVWDMAPGLFTITKEDLAGLSANVTEERKAAFEEQRALQQVQEQSPDLGWDMVPDLGQRVTE